MEVILRLAPIDIYIMAEILSDGTERGLSDRQKLALSQIIAGSIDIHANASFC